jgi:hypothetical protein
LILPIAKMVHYGDHLWSNVVLMDHFHSTNLWRINVLVMFRHLKDLSVRIFRRRKKFK